MENYFDMQQATCDRELKLPRGTRVLLAQVVKEQGLLLQARGLKDSPKFQDPRLKIVDQYFPITEEPSPKRNPSQNCCS